MVHGGHSLELPEGRLPIASIIEKVAQIHSGFVKVRIKPQGPPEMPAGLHLVSQAVETIGQGRHGVGEIGAGRDGLGEEIPGLGKEPLPIEGSTHGEHQLHVLVETHLPDLSEETQSLSLIAQAEKDFAHPHKGILVGGIHGESLLKRPPGPGELLTGQTSISQTYIEIYGIRIERKALSKHFEGPVKISIIVQLVCLFVVFLRAEEPIFLHGRLLEGSLSVKIDREGCPPRFNSLGD
jgi:hypothetical protein